ncbi:S1C family serine protease [Patescibacteria group bacterium]|nr:S1C family serine protease [Patescibacteria group bacterium]
MRFPVFLGILVALLVAISLAAFTGSTSTVTPTASSTALFEALPQTLTLTPAPGMDASTTIAATSTQPEKPKAAKQPAPAKAPAVTKPAVAGVTAAIPQPSQAEFDAAASALRGALVNILCSSDSTALHAISGSGVFIDPKGIILTNAHIGQYLLLEDYPQKGGTACVIRTGSPARTAYVAKPIYVSTSWLADNPSTLTQMAPTGTGEHDFALLAVTASATAAPLPDSFPYIPLSTSHAYTGLPVAIGSYAAQFLSANEIRSSLSPTLVFGSVEDIYTFATNTIDLFSLGGTAAAQEGSSGGGVADANGNLVGTITTSTVTGNTADRTLRAITTDYIARDYAAQTGSSLSALLAEPTTTAVADFAAKVPALEAALVSSITGS